MRTRTLSLIAASIAALSLAGTAFATETAEFPTARVRYGDLNLSSDAGVANLYARLRGAAKQVCLYSSFRMTDQGCVANALEVAVAKVGNERLQALHRQHSGVTAVATNRG
jgi:UrcA family protein